MKKKDELNILLVTDFFPYGFTEQFLETEIKYYTNVNVKIMPQHAMGNKRTISKSITIEQLLINNSVITWKDKVINSVKILFSSIFFKELINERIFTIQKLKAFRGSMLHYYHYYKLFDKYFRHDSNLENLVVYTYWNNEATYALQTLKNRYRYKLISRIHGYDLYKERRHGNYMPLKVQFTTNIDKIYTITEIANKYLIDNYNFSKDTLEVSRLGVEDKNITSLPNKENILHIVSCSFMTEVKQLHKIVEALAILGSQNSHITYIWTHIGDGVLYESIVIMAQKLLSNLTNVKCDFKGKMNNEDVYKFYIRNKVDVFINVSKSEGVPVSIMEAMSCHIPIVGPDIGGISDMIINNKSGLLLSSECLIDEIINALDKIEYFKDKRVRTNSYNIYREKYNAEDNYQLFILKLQSFTSDKDFL